MKPLTAVREYQYWSDRLVTKLWQDNVSQLPDQINLSAGLSNLGVQVQRQDSPDTRAARAAAVESLLADHIVTDLDYTGPLSYLAGRSDVVLSSLRNPAATSTGAVTLFADLVSPEDRRVAVCLFGSAQNVCNCDPEPPVWRRFGWTSSTDKGVRLLLKAATNAEGAESPEAYWHEAIGWEDTDVRDICWDAMNICSGQGQYHGNDTRAWHRGYTIGQYCEVEWLAQIFFTSSGPREGWIDSMPYRPYDVVYVGAAFWVRSASPRAWVPYTRRNIPKLDAAQHSIIQRPLARLRYRFRGQHIDHIRNSKKYPHLYE
jgi:hypothetical protein